MIVNAERNDSLVKYQIFPDLSDEEYQSLKNDIAGRGILIPIEIDETGEILDGHHRVRAWGELKAEGIKVKDFPKLIRAGLTEPEKLNHIRSLNLFRRHLTTEQRKPHWKEMRQSGMTYQAIAEASGVDRETVRKSISESDNSQSEITNARGQKRPAQYRPRQPKTVIALDSKDADVALRAIRQAGDKLPDKTITVKRAARIAREADSERRRRESKESPQPQKQGDIELRVGDFAECLSDLPSVCGDLILTDPPYGNGYLNSWSDLIIFADRILKPGGWLITYAGQYHFDSVISILNSKLKYIWTIAQINSASAKNIIHELKFYSQWKPILVYAKEPVEPLNWVNDLIEGGGREKGLHDWQQALNEAAYCIENFTKPGQLVLDPFLGSGTTALAAKRLGRNFIGCDLDAACVSKTWERLDE